MTRKVVSETNYVDPNKVGTRMESPTVHQDTIAAEWTCRFCGCGHISGLQKSCPECGHTKDEEVYQPPADPQHAQALTSEQLQQAGVTSDHKSDGECQFCGSRVKPDAIICPNCGSHIGEDQAQPEPQTWQRARHASLLDEPITRTPPELFTWIYGALALVVCLGLVAIAAYLLYPREAQTTVTAANWTSTISLQEYQYNQHQDWSIPQGGDYIREESRQHHTVQVYDHTENQCHYETVPDGYTTEQESYQDCHNEYDHTEVTCYDDGTCDREDVSRYVCETAYRNVQVPKTREERVCEDVKIYRDEPVYQQWYTYKIWEWVSIAAATTNGTGFEPQWPTVTLDDRHREAGREQTYDITLTVDGKDYHYEPKSLDEYRRFQLGTEWVIKHVGSKITSIKPAREADKKD